MKSHNIDIMKICNAVMVTILSASLSELEAQTYDVESKKTKVVTNNLTSAVVLFKDAAKIKSWDAWKDHEAKSSITNVLQRERPCVTWKKLNALQPGLKEIGRLVTRTSAEVRSSKWSVGCETLDRDYADWNAFKELIPLLGVKHARFFSGWAKTEQVKGKYDFTWLDQQIRECAAMGVKPWVCISYGNPVWGSDFRLGMRVKQVTGNQEAFAAWIRYTQALVERYWDVVDEWEIWNEPFDQPEEYAEMFYRTAKAVREIQPSAKCFCTAIGWNAQDPMKSDYAAVLERLKKEGALDLGSYFIYHPYDTNPDQSYDRYVVQIRKFVKGYSSKFDVMQGEGGCPSQLEFEHAMHGVEWTEYAQAKWNLRRALGDAVRSIPSNLFTMIDLQYTFMLQSFGLVRSNTLKEFVYRRPSWYAMRNVYALIDDETLPEEHLELKGFPIRIRADKRETKPRTLACSRFKRGGRSLRFYWFCEARPDSRLEFDHVDLEIAESLNCPVWVDMVTGRIFEIPEERINRRENWMALNGIPMWDSPVLIASREAVPFVVRQSTRQEEVVK